MIINLDKKFLDLDGKEIEPRTMAQELASMMSLSNTSLQFGIDSVRAWEISMSFYNTGSCDIDSAGIKNMINFINSLQISNLAKAQLINCIDEQTK